MYDEYKNPDKITLRMEIGSKSLSFPYSIPALFQRDMNTTQTIVGRIYCDSTQHQHIRFFSAALWKPDKWPLLLQSIGTKLCAVTVQI